MATKDQEKEALVGKFEGREAGVADLMEFYERVERAYARASSSMATSEVAYTSDWTDSAVGGEARTVGMITLTPCLGAWEVPFR